MPDDFDLDARARKIARRYCPAIDHELLMAKEIHAALKEVAADCARVAERERDEAREALLDTAARLVAAVSLLERGGKQAAPSDKMFRQMLLDYKASIGRARAVLKTEPDPGRPVPPHGSGPASFTRRERPNV